LRHHAAFPVLLLVLFAVAVAQSDHDAQKSSASSLGASQELTPEQRAKVEQLGKIQKNFGKRMNSPGVELSLREMTRSQEADRTLVRYRLYGTGLPAKATFALMQVQIDGSVNQVMDGMQKNIKPMMMNMLPPGEYRDKLIDLFFEKFRSKADVQVLINLTVEKYDKYLSEEEIKALIQFYSTTLGQKTLSVLPQLMVELQGESMKWGQDLGRQSMIEVLSEHPELRKALEDASQSAKPH